MESAKANERHPKSFLDRVFNFKLDSFAVMKEVCGANHAPMTYAENSAQVLSC